MLPAQQALSLRAKALRSLPEVLKLVFFSLSDESLSDESLLDEIFRLAVR